MSPSPSLLVLVPIVAALALGGCGGSSPVGAGSTPPGGSLHGGGSTLPGGSAASGGGGKSRASTPRTAGGSTSGASTSGSRSGGAATASQAAFVRAADRICQQTYAALGGLDLRSIVTAARARRISPAEYASRLAALTDRSAKIAGGAVAQLRALPRPSDRRVEDFLTVTATNAQLLHAEADALRRHDPRSFAQLNVRIVSVSRRSHDLARSYGFHVCGGTAKG